MAPTGYICPRCSCREVYRSRRSGLIDRLLSLFRFYPFICEESTCRYRFYQRQRS